jgi:hypothetical protein
VNAQGATRGELPSNLRETLREALEMNRDERLRTSGDSNLANKQSERFRVPNRSPGSRGDPPPIQFRLATLFVITTAVGAVFTLPIPAQWWMRAFHVAAIVAAMSAMTLLFIVTCAVTLAIVIFVVGSLLDLVSRPKNSTRISRGSVRH